MKMADGRECNLIPSSRAKFARAVEHFDTLQDSIVEFVGEKPFRLEREFDDQTGRHQIVFYATKEIPLSWFILIGEIVYNLRCALDHAVYELSRLENDGKPVSGTEFPIGTDRVKFYAKEPNSNAWKAGNGAFQIRRLNSTQKKIVEDLQPFDGRMNEDIANLLTLNRLCNVDKHRSVHVARIATANQAVSGTGDVKIFPPEMINARHVGDRCVVLEFARGDSARAGDKFEMNLEIEPTVRFHEDSEEFLYKRRPVLETLASLAETVEQIIDQLELAGFPNFENSGSEKPL
jgi:hypothetical protein